MFGKNHRKINHKQRTAYNNYNRQDETTKKNRHRGLKYTNKANYTHLN